MYKIETENGFRYFKTIEDAGEAYFPGVRIERTDGKLLSSGELDRALSAWLRSTKKDRT